MNQFSKSSGPDSLVTSRGEELKLDLSTRSRIEETGERMPDFAEKMRERLIQGGRRTNTSTWEDLVKQSESVLEGSRGPDGGDAMRDGDAFGANRSDSSGLPQAPGVEANTRDGTYVPPSLRRSMGIRGRACMLLFFFLVLLSLFLSIDAISFSFFFSCFVLVWDLSLL